MADKTKRVVEDVKASQSQSTLHQETSAPWLDLAWQKEAALAAEYLTLFDEDLRILFVNKTQKGAGEVVGKSMLDFLPPELHARWLNSARKMFSTQLPQHQETQATGPSGLVSFYSAWFTPFPNVEGRKLGLIVGTDITHQRRVEQKLEASDTMLRAVFEHAPITLSVIDQEHRVLFVNRLQNIPEQKVIGAKPQDFLPVEERERVTRILNEVFATGAPAEYEVRVEMPREEGPPIPQYFVTRVAPMEIDKKPAAALVVVEVTQERAAQSALTESEAKLRQAQKMEAVGQLTGGVAHDFNNLLTVIMGSVHLALDETDASIVKDCLQDALWASEKASSLTSRLLAFSRKQSLRPKLVDVPRLFSDLKTLFRRTLREELDLQLDCTPTTMSCFADLHQLENALLNLVLNAKDAIVGVGTIQLKAGDVEIKLGSREAETLPVGHYCSFSVVDTGLGMRDEHIARAFEPFFTTKEIGKGSGLGLSMVYGFAKQSGGHLSIKNNEKEGVTVLLLLPKTPR